LVDIDADGHIDLLSGSWPGELFLFRGGPGRTFGPPEEIKDKDGHVINIGGGVRKNNPDGMILVAGNAQFKEENGEQYIVYQGRKIKIPKGKQAGITGTASAVHAADWDGDGDLDLIVGEIGGTVSLVLNEGTARAYRFGKDKPLKAGGQPLKVEGDAGPFVADWDGDGKPDLLVGAGNGSVTLFRNIGTSREPKLAAGKPLVAQVEMVFGPNAPKAPRRGIRAKVCAADWNGDGRLDLLVGDYATQAPDRPEPTPAEKAEHEKLRKELNGVMREYRTLVDKVFGRASTKDAKEREAPRKELHLLTERMRALQAKLPPEYENHGWVWLFLRKPAELKTGSR
jgi:hypothetical protein